MGIQLIRQEQIISNRGEFTNLSQQMTSVEDRTRAIARINYNLKTQWENGTLVNIDPVTILDSIQLSKNGVSTYFETGQFDTFYLDLGSSNVKVIGIEYEHILPANTTVSYSIRGGPTEVSEGGWTTWQVLATEGKVDLPLERYVQVRANMTTSDPVRTPVVNSISVVVWASAGAQELYDARAGYQNLNSRIEQLGNVYQLKVTPADGQTDITLSRAYSMGDGTLKVYLNGMLQTEPEAYEEINNYSIQFTEGLSRFDVVVCRIEGAGAGVVVLKESRIVNEVPTGAIDGINKIFTLAKQPVISLTEIYVEGIKMAYGIDNDYLIDNKNIIFNYGIPVGLAIRVTYSYIK